MKIAIIGSKGIPATYGGTQIVVENIAKNLSKLGCEITVYSRHYYSTIKTNKFKYHGINVINIKGIKSKKFDTISHSFLSALHAAINDYDIVVFHQWIPAIFAFIPKIFGKTTVFHSHGINQLGDPDMRKFNKFNQFMALFISRLTNWSIDYITTVSIAEINIIEKIYKKKVLYIPNGICISSKKTNFHNNKRSNYILTVGRIVDGKGLEYLIPAFNNFSSEFQNIKLLIVGEPVFTDNYYKTLLFLGNNNKNIIFLGSKYGDDLIKLYSEAFCVVIPSENESFSLVLLEALVFNGVVLCSDIPQFKKFADKYVEFFRSGNEDSLLIKLKELFSNSKKVNNLMISAKKFPVDEFSWENISKKYFNLYNEISDKKKKILILDKSTK